MAVPHILRLAFVVFFIVVISCSSHGVTAKHGVTPDDGDSPDDGDTPKPGVTPDDGDSPDDGDTPKPGVTPDDGDAPNNGVTPKHGVAPKNGVTPDDGVAPKDCPNDLFALSQSCGMFIVTSALQNAPSKACCSTVQKVNVPCACGKVNVLAEVLVSMENMVSVAEKCEKPLPSGSKCGSYAVP